MDDAIAAIYRELDHDHAMASAIDAYSGLRLLCHELWESQASYMRSNTNSIRDIRESVGKIATLSRWGVSLEQAERYFFP